MALTMMKPRTRSSTANTGEKVDTDHHLDGLDKKDEVADANANANTAAPGMV
jgi:hypothetical protein